MMPISDAMDFQGADTWSFIKNLFFRIMVIYFVTSLLRSFTGNSGGGRLNDSGGSTTVLPPSKNLFPPGQKFDLYVYFSESMEQFSSFNEPTSLFWKQNDLTYGDWTSGPNNDGSVSKSATFPTPSVLLNNGSLFLHVFIVKKGQSPDPRDRHYVKREVIYHVHQLNKYKKKFYKKTQNLLTGKTEQSEEDRKKADMIHFEVLNHWHPNLTINLVDDQTAWQKGALPAPLDEAVKFIPITNTYQPIFIFNDYWNLAADFMPINESVRELNFTLTYAPLTLFKWQLYASQQMRGKWSQMFGGEMFEGDDDDQDSIKQALLETNPVLLGKTLLIGLSVRSVLFNVFQSVIVFLYICDNDTSVVVKFSVGIGLLIELWKIPKCLNITIDRTNKILGVVPKVSFSDKGSYVESDTRQYDELAFKYLSWVLFPLLGGYAIYSLVYVEQRGWYNWVLGMLYGFLLTFGFIMMTPQLFINYKLKSVAHLPWRMLTYKFINTFIDDLFAFVIRMPTMYRIGCFRDDIIFLIYIYQRWIYRVDPTRLNEFGVSLEDPTGEKAAEEERKKLEAISDEPRSDHTHITDGNQATSATNSSEESKKEK
ncbi:unnamed protein product [Anisakis simplex]|uniref:Cleft lip and palate transmembrane protein 1 (inferred by orthology to a human protein) n=1 Tax=Anisakis simplex TaxID=6269 RepID=A0A0M3JR67_ANISI|nr:unnamed protein product [Anisakis simplex]